MSYQDRIDIDRLYDLIYDTQSQQLKVITRDEFEQIIGSTRDLKDKMDLYPDKSEVELEILRILKEAGVITDDQYNELVGRIEAVRSVANRADGNATNALGTASTAQRTADGADTKATNAQTVASNANSTASRAENTASDAYDLANGADSKADRAISDSSDAYDLANTANGKADNLRNDVGTVTGGNLQSQINTVDGKADDLRDDVGTVTGDDLQTQVTTANGTASNAYTLADGADTKADDLRTDVGTVNQPTDGSLQQQITYLPAYISDLMVTQSSSTSEMGLPIFCSEFSSSVWYIGFRLTELAKKTIRDYGSITFTIKLNKPNNTTETINHTINNPSQGSIPSIVKIAYPNFLDLWGVTLITCENLKYIIIIGGVATKSHVHTISNITNLQATLNNKSNNGHTHSISDVTNLQTSLDGKANSTHSHSISEVTNLQSSLDSKANSTHSHSISEVTNLQSSLDAKQDSISWETKSVGVGTLEVCSALRLAHWSGGGFYNVTQNYKTMTGVDLSDYAPNKPITNFADSINPLLIIYIQTDGVVKYASQSSTGNFYLSWDILWKY